MTNLSEHRGWLIRVQHRGPAFTASTWEPMYKRWVWTDSAPSMLQARFRARDRIDRVCAAEAEECGGGESRHMKNLATPKITAIAPWFGSKRQIARHIVSVLGNHSAYFEPFCGSMAVLLAKQPSRMETVNDLHGDLINMARCIRDPILGPKLYRQARRIIASDAELKSFDAPIRYDSPQAPETINADRALAFFVSSWMGRNGEVGLAKAERGRDLSVRWGAGGGDCSTRYHAAVSSIPAWRRRLRDVLILNRDGFDILEKINDKSDAAIYCDPPYIIKSDQYLHDFGNGFMGEDDHSRLAKVLAKFRRARVVVSYYEHPRLAELYPAWRKIDLIRNRNLSSVSGADGSKKAPEILLINPI